MTVANIDAVLYLPGHSREELERALRIPALSQGWQTSFQAMLEEESSPKTVMGNPGLANEQPMPAWPGFKQMRVASIGKESDSVTSFVLAPIDAQTLPILPAWPVCCFPVASGSGQTASSSQLFAQRPARSRPLPS
jgi:hypothetical protein